MLSKSVRCKECNHLFFAAFKKQIGTFEKTCGTCQRKKTFNLDKLKQEAKESRQGWQRLNTAGVPINCCKKNCTQTATYRKPNGKKAEPGFAFMAYDHKCQYHALGGDFVKR